MFFSFEDDDPRASKGPATIPDSIYLNARRNEGNLNLSNRRLHEVPENVWKFNENTFGEEKWWELHCLRRLNLSSNQLHSFDYEAFKKAEAAELATNPLSKPKKQQDPYDGRERPPFMELVRLDLSGNHIMGLPMLIWQLTALTYLNLSHNSSQSLHIDIPSESGLEWLSISDNKLNSITEQSFRSLVHLTHLDLSNNALQHLPSHMFSHLPKLKTLLLGHNKLAELPEDESNWAEVGPSLTELDIGHNQIKALPNHMNHLSNLTKLDARQNRLTSLDNVDLSGSRLSELVLFMNALKSIPKWFLSLKAINYASFAENSIAAVPVSVISLTSLQRLDLSANDLSDGTLVVKARAHADTNISLLRSSSVPPELGLMTQLRLLNIDGNALRGWKTSIISGSTEAILEYLRNRLPAGSASGSSTKTAAGSIYVPDNGVVSLARQKLTKLTDDSFSSASAPRVKALKLEMNNLTSISADAVGTLVNLTLLDVSGNKALAELPHTIASCTALSTLNLSRTGFRKIPSPVFSCAASLTTLEIAGIGLESLGDEILPLKHLRKINLGYNRLKEIPAALYQLSQLEEILIDNNNIDKLDADGLLRLEALRVLDINCNDLTDLPARLGLHACLRVLEIEGNSIKSIKRSVIESGCADILRTLRDRIPQ